MPRARSSIRPATVAALVASAVLARLQAADGPLLSIAAGAHERVATLVTLQLPEAIARGPWSLATATGQRLAVQVDDQHHGYLRIPRLAAGATLAGRLEPVAADGAPSVLWQRSGDTLAARCGDRQLARYVGGAGTLPAGVAEVYRRGGYLTDLVTAGGVLVTDDYPPNHLHHHGIWTAWTKTRFAGRTPDFWNMGDRTGTVQAVAIDGTWDGAWCAGLHARHRYLSLGGAQPEAAIDERWDAFVTAPLPDAPVTVDLAFTHTCSGAQPLVLTPYHYGGLGVRGNRAWNGVGACRFLTSAGQDREHGDESRARWCWMGGEVEGRTAGLLMLDHPQNFRAPEPVRLNPKEPFFCYAPSQLGEWSIVPGTPLTLHYRIIAWDGAPDAAQFDRLWDDFAEPPLVTIATEAPGR